MPEQTKNRLGFNIHTTRNKKEILEMNKMRSELLVVMTLSFVCSTTIEISEEN